MLYRGLRYTQKMRKNKACGKRVFCWRSPMDRKQIHNFQSLSWAPSAPGEECKSRLIAFLGCCMKSNFTLICTMWKFLCLWLLQHRAYNLLSEQMAVCHPPPVTKQSQFFWSHKKFWFQYDVRKRETWSKGFLQHIMLFLGGTDEVQQSALCSADLVLWFTTSEMQLLFGSCFLFPSHGNLATRGKGSKCPLFQTLEVLW